MVVHRKRVIKLFSQKLKKNYGLSLSKIKYGNLNLKCLEILYFLKLVCAKLSEAISEILTSFLKVL